MVAASPVACAQAPSRHAGSPSCFCFGDYDGSDCSTISSAKSCSEDDAGVGAGLVAGLVTIGLLCLVIIAVVAFLVRETRKNNVTYRLLLDRAAGPATTTKSNGGRSSAGPPGEIELC